ncbi:MAG: hypothetical protein QOF48_2915 [Verrucomicrobiota bacterium]
MTLAGVFAATAADPVAPSGGPDQQGNNRGGRGNFPGRGGVPGGRGGPGGPGGLGLDDKQMELYREASEQNREALTQLDEKLRAAQKELLQAAIAEKYDDKTVREKADAVSRIQVEMTMLRAKALSTVAPTLKAEQRDQLESSRMAAGMLTSGGMGFGGNGPGGFGGNNGGPGGGGPGGPNGGQGGQGGQGGNNGNGGFRGRGNPATAPGAENTTGGGQGGQRRNRGGQPPQAPPTQQ